MGHVVLTLSYESVSSLIMATKRHANLTEAEAIEQVKAGLAWAEVIFLAGKLGISLDHLADLLDIPNATFFRRKGGRFTVQESDHIMRYALLFDLARSVMENDEGAREWLSTPEFALNGITPLEHARTEVGARQVTTLLHRIDHGIAI